jgi:hypothetical protein
MALTKERVLEQISDDLRLKSERLLKQGHHKAYGNIVFAARDIDNLSRRARERRPSESVLSQIAKLRQEVDSKK